MVVAPEELSLAELAARYEEGPEAASPPQPQTGKPTFDRSDTVSGALADDELGFLYEEGEEDEEGGDMGDALDWADIEGGESSPICGVALGLMHFRFNPVCPDQNC